MALMTEGVVPEKRDKDQNPMMKGRVYRLALDQHGRRWGAEIDKRTDQPCSPITPSFQAPWIPDAKYVTWTYDDASGAFRVVINYAEDKGDRKAAITEWQKTLLQTGAQLEGQSFDPSRPSIQVMMRVGPKPPPPEVVIAAEKGDPWVLGFSPDMPKWARPYFAKMLEDEAAFLTDESDDEIEVVPVEAPRRGRPRKA